MDEQQLENAEQFDLEDILREFSDDPDSVVHLEPDPEPEPIAAPLDEPEPAFMTDDTIRMDAIGGDIPLPKGEVRIAAPVEENDAFTDGWEPEYEQPIGEYVPPQPIIFHPKSRLRELKRKLVAGPERRYYQLSEKGLGKLQAAIFLSVLVVLLGAGATALYAAGLVQPERLRLMVFGQFLAMLLSALLGSFQLLEGITDLIRRRFSLNTALVFIFLLCCIDGILGLQQLRVPCCAAFSLSMTMSLWCAYERRNTELGQMDTMRKATHLDALGAQEGYFEDRKGFVRFEGQVEDFMDRYDAPSGPERLLDRYALIAVCVSAAVGILGCVLHGFSAGIQAAAAAALAAFPATVFITLSRPFAVLERRLHRMGTVLCGWQGVLGLSGKAVFPLAHEDLFPAGTVRLNGVKFFGDRQPDDIVACCAALIRTDGGGLSPLFTQLLDSRSAPELEPSELRSYPGGLGGIIGDETVLVGSISFLREMSVEVPEGLRALQAVCVAIDGVLCGLFAISYEASGAAGSGLGALCGAHGLAPLLTDTDFMLTESFLHAKLGVNTRRLRIPGPQERAAMSVYAEGDLPQALLLTTREGLVPIAGGVAGARALRTASILGTAVHMAGGIVGLAMMLTLVLLGRIDLMTPFRMFLYQLVWMVPGLLLTEWTR